MAQDKKQDAIIEAAYKRFSHFGVGKTTMNDIADDLSMSKASLYYYFPDKLNLYAAVLQKIIKNAMDIEPALLKEKSLLKAIHKFLEIRTELIIQHYNILEYLRTVTSIPEELQAIFLSARRKDIGVIANIIAKNAEVSQVKIKAPEEQAVLMLDCLEGLRYVAFNGRTNFFPDKQQFYDLLKREKEFAAIFVRGIMS